MAARTTHIQTVQENKYASLVKVFIEHIQHCIHKVSQVLPKKKKCFFKTNTHSLEEQTKLSLEVMEIMISSHSIIKKKTDQQYHLLKENTKPCTFLSVTVFALYYVGVH
jgi:hypothetical protein